jgi:PncC family amidohydrolase
MAIEFAHQLIERLAQLDRRIVFAESCTGGLVSAELAKVPGVSDWLCGSAVTYRCDTKVQWLGVRTEDIDEYTAVSKEVACQMAEGVLRSTPEASLSASITGHFGPHAPDGFDGVVFVGVATRNGGITTVEVARHQLVETERERRQEEAVKVVLQMLLSMLA